MKPPSGRSARSPFRGASSPCCSWLRPLAFARRGGRPELFRRRQQRRRRAAGRGRRRLHLPHSIRLLFWLIFHHPLIGIPLTIVVVFAFVRWNKKGGATELGLGAFRPVIYPAAAAAAPAVAGPGAIRAPRSGFLDRPLRRLRLRPLSPARTRHGRAGGTSRRSAPYLTEAAARPPGAARAGRRAGHRRGRRRAPRPRRDPARPARRLHAGPARCGWSWRSRPI